MSSFYSTHSGMCLTAGATVWRMLSSARKLAMSSCSHPRPSSETTSLGAKVAEASTFQCLHKVRGFLTLHNSCNLVLGGQVNDVSTSHRLAASHSTTPSKSWPSTQTGPARALLGSPCMVPQMKFSLLRGSSTAVPVNDMGSPTLPHLLA